MWSRVVVARHTDAQSLEHEGDVDRKYGELEVIFESPPRIDGDS